MCASILLFCVFLNGLKQGASSLVWRQTKGGRHQQSALRAYFKHLAALPVFFVFAIVDERSVMQTTCATNVWIEACSLSLSAFVYARLRVCATHTFYTRGCCSFLSDSRRLLQSRESTAPVGATRRLLATSKDHHLTAATHKLHTRGCRSLLMLPESQT